MNYCPAWLIDMIYKQVKTVTVEKKLSEIVNRLNKTSEEHQPDLRAEREERDRQERLEKRRLQEEEVGASLSLDRCYYRRHLLQRQREKETAEREKKEQEQRYGCQIVLSGWYCQLLPAFPQYCACERNWWVVGEGWWAPWLWSRAQCLQWVAGTCFACTGRCGAL